MLDRIGYTWQLMGASWNVLRRDKRLLIFPALSFIACVIVTASFAVPMFATGFFRPPGPHGGQSSTVLYYGILFLFYICTYSVAFFFNAAIVACAVRSMRGEEATPGDGLRIAASRLHAIIGWAVVSATVGLALRIIEDRSKKVGAIIAGLLGIAWSLMTFLVVPVIVVEGKGPIEAVKVSAGAIKRTWGEQVVGNFSFGLIFFLLAIPGIVGIVAGVVVASTTAALGFVLIGAAVLYLLALGLVSSALAEIFRAAVYLYAARIATPAGFAPHLLDNAMRRKN